jgi:hypothetical protein
MGDILGSILGIIVFVVIAFIILPYLVGIAVSIFKKARNKFD